MRRSLCKTTGIVAAAAFAAAFAAGPTELTEERLTDCGCPCSFAHGARSVAATATATATAGGRAGAGGVRNFETSAQSAFTSSSFRPAVQTRTARKNTKCRDGGGIAYIALWLGPPLCLQLFLLSFCGRES